MKLACCVALLSVGTPFGWIPPAPKTKGPLDTPDLSPYNATEVMCTLGKEKVGPDPKTPMGFLYKPKIHKWCVDWMACIKTKAAPEGTAASVMIAWAPAPCEEYCGKWPATTPKEGVKKPSLTDAAPAPAPAPAFLQEVGEGACIASCKAFQKSLSGCVAKITFEPSQVAAMGMPKAAPKPPALCTKIDTPCVPGLEINYQKCMHHKTMKAVDSEHKIPKHIESACKLMKANVKDCKASKCPAMNDAGGQFAAYTGGCMDQLNAYWQATHPSAGGTALPGATGCKVHTI